MPAATNRVDPIDCHAAVKLFSFACWDTQHNTQTSQLWCGRILAVMRNAAGMAFYERVNHVQPDWRARRVDQSAKVNCYLKNSGPVKFRLLPSWFLLWQFTIHSVEVHWHGPLIQSCKTTAPDLTKRQPRCSVVLKGWEKLPSCCILSCHYWAWWGCDEIIAKYVGLVLEAALGWMTLCIVIES